MLAMQKMFGKSGPRSLRQTPTIAILGSGGGFRKGFRFPGNLGIKISKKPTARDFGVIKYPERPLPLKSELLKGHGWYGWSNEGFERKRDSRFEHI